MNLGETNSKDLAMRVRKSILEISYRTQSPHLGSSLSCVELLLAAYETKLKLAAIGNSNCKVVFSKGHASLAVYCTLMELGILPISIREKYNQPESHFYGHVSHKASEQIELSTGSLGHGLPFAIGLALGQKMHGYTEAPIIAILSDGECDEGTTWESALIANQFNLNNVIVIIDRNELQSLSSTEDTLKLEPLAEKWQSFGWEVVEADGHNLDALHESIRIGNQPKCIIARTHKGNGVTFMRDSVLWHYKSPNKLEYEEAIKELEV